MSRSVARPSVRSAWMLVGTAAAAASGSALGACFERGHDVVVAHAQHVAVG